MQCFVPPRRLFMRRSVRLFTDTEVIFCHPDRGGSLRAGDRLWVDVEISSFKPCVQVFCLDHTRYAAYDPASDYFLFSGTGMAQADLGRRRDR